MDTTVITARDETLRTVRTHRLQAGASKASRARTKLLRSAALEDMRVCTVLNTLM
jgi:hypothetical protein